ncbi:adhesion G protein-coupled receptor L3-like [Ruditapes philippinarum]|uniref:adhesion G protein-coupled receptor L3-like n=1 Tax=Ruditapes philippinarum TaxID=129788 RepID=UPI00295B6256|nr:adhesion G protein-coupled receptor L3-like [Ruditapes philippinarum]
MLHRRSQSSNGYTSESNFLTKLPVTVIAADGGTPALSSTVDVTVNIITGCSKLQDRYGSWPVSEINNSVTVPCEDSYGGNYTRVCDENGSWGPVTSYCKVKDTVLTNLQLQLNSVSNASGNASGEIENILESLSKITDNQIDSGIITNVTDILKGVLNIADYMNITDNSTEYFYETISNVLKPENEEAFKQADVDGSVVLDVVDKYMLLQQETKCNNLNTGDVNEIENNHIYTEIGRISGEVLFPNIKRSETNIDIMENTLTNLGITNVCFGGAYYNSLGNVMENQVTLEGQGSALPTGEVNSDIISLQLLTDPGVSLDNLDPPVRITFTLINGTYTDPICVFWDYNITTGQSKRGAWSSKGCVLEEITNVTAKCACSHLTNFAILMSPSKISAHHSLILGIISAVGCTISMICLVLTIIAHRIVWSVVRSNRTITLMHLCVALLLAFGVFLAGVNRTESRVACIIIAALIQFLFLAVFFLMLFIGVEILLSVVQVFGSRFRLSRLLPLAWLAPLVIVGVSLGVTKTEGYGNKKFCWLDIDSGLIWSFIGPAAAVILVNVIIIVIVFKKMASATFVKSKTSTTKLKTWLHSLCVLLPMLGITWLFGLLSVNSDMFILQYFFSIFNSLQGLFIFLFHCVFNRQIRQALTHRKERRRTLASFESEIRNTTKDEHSKSAPDPVKKTGPSTRFEDVD